MVEEEDTAPKVFISYSWTSEEHTERVLALAKDLRSAGVDAIIDKWDLKEGQESTAFMEKMVTDSGIKKVLIVSDKMYVEKSNSRSGGVGAEAQIISPNIFEKENQEKFAVVVFENDPDGRPFIPAYYTSRIFIDFTDNTEYSGKFEQLVRWIFNKPLHRRPALGKQPAYLQDDNREVTLSTSVAHRRAIDAVKNSKPYAISAAQEYFELFTSELSLFRLNPGFDPLSDEVSQNYESFLPYRDEALSLIKAIAYSTEDERYGDISHDFLERFLPYFVSQSNAVFREFDFDNFRFFAHELFLHIVNIFLSNRRVDLMDSLTGRPFYNPVSAERHGNGIESFTEFSVDESLLKHRSDSRGRNRRSPRADLLKERLSGTGVQIDRLIQADFVLFLRHRLHHNGRYYGWAPQLFHLINHWQSPFELFARAQSARELNRLLPLLGLNNREPLDALVKTFSENPDLAPRVGTWGRLQLASLIGYESLGTRP